LITQKGKQPNIKSRRRRSCNFKTRGKDDKSRRIRGTIKRIKSYNTKRKYQLAMDEAVSQRGNAHNLDSGSANQRKWN